jgi:type I restriction enzyme S subunit
LFLSPEFNRELVTSATGTKILHTAPGRIEAFECRLPPIDEQRRIADVLGTLDDKIELNRRMSETLEAMARALFKSWFVDFDPVRARAEGRDTGLPNHIADLFPDSFEASEIGEIPKGWRVANLSAVAVLNPESWSAETCPAELRYVDLANTKWGRIESVAEYTRATAPSRAQRVLRPGDTIVGTVRPGNGSFALIHDEGLTGSTAFAVLRPTSTTAREFVFLAATEPMNIETLAHLADGGAYPAVRSEVVLDTPCVHPGAQIIQAFSRLVAPLLERRWFLEAEARTLGAVRDAFLPKLVSGELRLKASQAPVGASA